MAAGGEERSGLMEGIRRLCGFGGGGRRNGLGYWQIGFVFFFSAWWVQDA